MSRLNKQLLAAAEGGDVNEVKRVLTAGAKPDARGKNDWTALHLAAQGGHAEIIELLLSAGANVNAKDKSRMAPLQMAAFLGHLAAVKALVKGGSDINAGAGDDGQTSLHGATAQGRVEVVVALLDAGANTEVATTDGMTPLFGAAFRGHPQIAAALLAAGANRNAKASNGWTALDFAKKKGLTDVIEILRTDPSLSQSAPVTTLATQTAKEIQPSLNHTPQISHGITGAGSELFEVVMDVFVGLSYGDLFICSERLIFVTLAHVHLPQGGLAGMGSDMVGTLAREVGLVSRKAVMLEAMKNARNAASHARTRFIGLSLDARIRGESRVVPRAKIQSLKLHRAADDVGVIEATLASGAPLMMEVTGAAQLYDRLHLWLIGKPVSVSCDRQGVDIALPLPSQMLAWIEDQSKVPNVSLDDCSRAATTANYCKELVEELKKRDLPQRERLCQLIKERTAPLASSIGEALAKSSGGHWTETATRMCGTFGGLGFLMALASYPEPGTAWLTGFGVSLSVLALVALHFEKQARRRNEHLAASLQSQEKTPSVSVMPLPRTPAQSTPPESNDLINAMKRGDALPLPPPPIDAADRGEDDNDIEFDCPHCHTHIIVDKEGAGMELPCPRCSKKIEIPTPPHPDYPP